MKLLFRAQKPLTINRVINTYFQIALYLKTITHFKHTFINQNKNKVNIFFFKQKDKLKNLKVKVHFLSQIQSDNFFELFLYNFIFYKLFYS